MTTCLEGLFAQRVSLLIRYHDLRHYFASLLIASGADVKTV